MTKIEIAGKKFNIPESWNEMTRAQLLKVAAIAMDQHSALEFKILVLLALTGWKMAYTSVKWHYRFIIDWKTVVEIQIFQLNELLHQLDFLTKETETRNGKVTFIYSKLYENKILHYGLFFRKYGPADQLFNITFGEYLAADTYFNRYFETNNQEFLDKLVATLYRPKKKGNRKEIKASGDVREPFNSHTVESRAKHLQYADPALKTAVLLFYQGCKHALIERFPNVFRNDGGGRSRYGALSLVDSLTNGDVTKSESIRSQYLYDVFVHLDNLVEQNERMKQMAKGKGHGA